MKGKVIQITAMPEGEHHHAALWVLTSDGEIYCLNLGRNEWRRENLPTGDVPTERSEEPEP